MEKCTSRKRRKQKCNKNIKIHLLGWLIEFIIQQIVTMPIYGKEALNISHPT